MSTVEIKIDGTDLTSQIVFSTAFFASAVNGAIGECKFRVRDDDRTLAFVTGVSIELLVDGEPVWTGFLTQQLRVYAFPAENIVDAGLTRWLDIVGVDLNVLFAKRFVFTVADPTVVFGKLYGPNQPDDDAIADLVADYLDLSGDGLDTSTKVEFVGNINVDQAARAWLAGDSFGQAMASIASLPGAVYFIDPARFLVYTDANTADAPFGLSDQPDGVTTVGYREMAITEDGSSLANDVLAWGLGYGSTEPVFERAEDATSENLHGLWQAATVRSGIYKQATIDRVADSILNGSPENLRGAKDDKVGVRVVTYAPGFLPAQKVDFTSAVWGFNDVIPIRRMRITFDAPDTPRYELSISHDIDQPWGFFDQFLLKLPRLPRLPPLPGFPPIVGCVCGVTDTFSRIVTDGWGKSDAGIDWTSSGVSFSVDGARGFVKIENGSTGNASFNDLEGFFYRDATVLLQVIDDTPGAAGTRHIAIGGDTVDFNDFVQVEVTTGGNLTIDTNDESDSTSTAVDISLPFYIRIQVDGTNAKGKIWQADDPQPGSWDLSVPFLPTDLYEDFFVGVSAVGATPTLFNVAVDNVNIEGVDRCSVIGIFDNFRRNISDGWGTAITAGVPWVGSGVLTYSEATVEGNHGRLWTDASGGSAQTGSNNEAAAAPSALSLPLAISFQIQFVTLSESSNPPAYWTPGEIRNPFINFILQGATSGEAFLSFTLGDTSVYPASAQMVTLGNDDVVTDFSWTHSTGAWYNVELNWRTTVLEVRLWLVGTARPSAATFSINGSSAPPLVGAPTFSIEQRQATGSSPDIIIPEFEVWVTNLDFDYPGKPCVFDSTAIDLFDRADSVNNYTGNDHYDVAALGTPTRGSPAWLGQFFNFGDTASGAEAVGFAVADGEGNIDMTTPARVGSLALDIQALASVPLAPTASGDECRIEFDVTCIDATPAPSTSPGVARTTFYAGLLYNDGSGIPFDLVTNVQVSRSREFVGTVDTKSRFVTVEGTSTEVDASPAAGLPLTHVIIDRSVSRGTTQVTFGAYPVVEEAISGNTPNEFFFMVETESYREPGWVSTIRVDNIYVGGTPEFPAAGAAVGIAGFGCESPTRSSGTTFVTGSIFVPGSTLVFKAGLFQLRGTDYEEGADHASIVFSAPASDPVRVCYMMAIQS